ncbi:MAG: IS30 family transposase [Pseudomonadota bacterium]
MARKPRRYLTIEQTEDLWARWSRGESLKAIGRAFDKTSSAIYLVLSRTGGIRPLERKRHPRSLTLCEREEISRGLAQGWSIRAIADAVGRAASTISREVRRNGGRTAYRAASAERRAWDTSRRPKACKLAGSIWLRRVVTEKLKINWSPEQIAGWLKREFADDEEKWVSHETIYKSLFIQARGVLKKELMARLRSRRTIRRSRHSTSKGDSRGQIVDAVSIRERPASIEGRAIPGHWERDLIAGTGGSYIATLVERHSRYCVLVKVNSKNTDEVVSALIRQANTIPAQVLKSLTWDRGLEMAAHRRFTVATDVDVYFCDPQSPWQRGSNENTNRLLRQYFPKRTDLLIHSQATLDQVALQLNERPRKTLNFRSPAERFDSIINGLT